MSSMISYVLFAVAIVLLVLWVKRRAANKRPRGR